ncbi:MAG TPA: FliM/FliN family flagellar motor switch protein [Acidimicrobiales bacterium]|nr:FliM/FliN family flagellar motor switch protein [Acidimicrobiales bacterium]
MSVVRAHDFRRSEGIDRSFLRALHAIFDTFGRHATVDLSTLLRRQCQLVYGRIDEMMWREASEHLGDPPYLVTFTLAPFTGTAAMSLPLETAMRILELRLGGGARPAYRGHAEPTETDLGVIGPVIQGMLDELSRSLSRVRETTAVIVGQDSNLQFVQLATPNEMCLLVHFELILGEDEPVEAVLCLPFSLVRHVVEAMRAARPVGGEGDTADSVRGQVFQTPLEVHLEIPPIELMPPEVASLRPGDVVRLYHPLDRPLDLRAEGVLVARARQGRSGARVACSIVEEVQEA